MSRQVVIVTPENVQIEYELAGIASRGGAVIIDMLLQGASIVVVLLLWAALSWVFGWKTASWLDAIFYIFLFVLFYGYHVYFETVWNGQTPGKRYARLRAVREGGLPIDLPCAAIRNLVRFIDAIPSMYVLGGIIALCNSKNKRLGDIAAGTIVVKERSEWAEVLKKPAVPQTTARFAEADYIRNIELVSNEEFEAIKRFLDRKAELEDYLREQLAFKIAKPLVDKLGIEAPPGVGIRYSNLLVELHRACVEQRGMQ